LPPLRWTFSECHSWLLSSPPLHTLTQLQLQVARARRHPEVLPLLLPLREESVLASSPWGACPNLKVLWLWGLPGLQPLGDFRPASSSVGGPRIDGLPLGGGLHVGSWVGLVPSSASSFPGLLSPTNATSPMVWAYRSLHLAPPPQAVFSPPIGISTEGNLGFLGLSLGLPLPPAASPPPQLCCHDPNNDILPLPHSLPLHSGSRHTSDPSILGQSRAFTLPSVVVPNRPPVGRHSNKAYGSQPPSSVWCLDDGYHGRHLSSSSSARLFSPASSPSSTFRHGGGSNLSDYNASEWGSSSADDLSSFTTSFPLPPCPLAPSAPGLSPNPEGPPPPPSQVPVLATLILLPVDCFTLIPINSGDNYLHFHDLILFWLCSPGFSRLEMTPCSLQTPAMPWLASSGRTSFKPPSRMVWFGLFLRTEGQPSSMARASRCSDCSKIISAPLQSLTPSPPSLPFSTPPRVIRRGYMSSVPGLKAK
jgi:hypothetical protein